MPRPNLHRLEGRRQRQFSLPLRYRDAVVGVLVLEGGDTPELSRYEQSMLAVVASYMAGVVERTAPGRGR